MNTIPIFHTISPTRRHTTTVAALKTHRILGHRRSHRHQSIPRQLDSIRPVRYRFSWVKPNKPTSMSIVLVVVNQTASNYSDVDGYPYNQYNTSTTTMHNYALQHNNGSDHEHVQSNKANTTCASQFNALTNGYYTQYSMCAPYSGPSRFKPISFFSDNKEKEKIFHVFLLLLKHCIHHRTIWIIRLALCSTIKTRTIRLNSSRQTNVSCP